MRKTPILSFTMETLTINLMMMMMIIIMMIMMNLGDRRKTFSLISSRDHCRRSSPSRISDTLQAGFEPVQNLSSGFVEWLYIWICWVFVHLHKSKQNLIKQRPFSYLINHFWVYHISLLANNRLKVNISTYSNNRKVSNLWKIDKIFVNSNSVKLSIKISLR